MSLFLAEHTRDQIAERAAETLVILPTASIEQHGPHLPIGTDWFLCTAIAERAAQKARAEIPVWIAPALPYGNAHHHFPFAGVLSLTSSTFMQAVTDLLTGLVRSGFEHIVLLNGHGGNSDSNGVVGLDFVHRLDYRATLGVANYWDLARDAVRAETDLREIEIPGHAGRFETALMQALRPEWVDLSSLKETSTAPDDARLFEGPAGATVFKHGAWAAGPGYSDHPARATAEQGRALLQIITDQVSDFLIHFYQTA